MRDALFKLFESVLRPLKVPSERPKWVLLVVLCIITLVEYLLIPLLALNADDVGFEWQTL